MSGQGANFSADDELKSLVRRIEAVEDRIATENTDKSEIYKEASGSGFDVKVLRKVVAARRKDPSERAEQDALFDLYWNSVNGVAHAHVETVEQFPPGEDQMVSHGQPIPPVAAAQTVPSGGANTSQAGGGAVETPAINSEPATPNQLETAHEIPADAGPNHGGDHESVTASQLAVEPARPAEAAAMTDVDTGKSVKRADASAIAFGSDVEAVAPLSADLTGKPAGEQPAAPQPFKTAAAEAMERVAAERAKAAKPDRTKPNPICMDPAECGVEASWDYTCLDCLRKASDAARARGPDPVEERA